MTNTTTLRQHDVQQGALSLPGRILLGLAATALIALASHVAFPLPFTPVPFILTPLAVLATGLAFGPTGGFLVLLAYLAEGVAGLPVFGPSGPGGVLQLLGPTGGFLRSYPLVALIAGGLTRVLQPHTSRFIAALAASIIAIAALFACGAAWFLHAMPGATTALTMHAAVLPFLPGEAVKAIVAAGAYSTLTRARRA